MVEIFEAIVHKGGLTPLLVVGCIIVVVLIKTVGLTVRSVARERTRCEVAAYIAEGSMSPEQGERLMKSGANDAC